MTRRLGCAGVRLIVTSGVLNAAASGTATVSSADVWGYNWGYKYRES